MEGPDYNQLLQPLVAGRRVILAGGVVAAFTPVAQLIHRLGAEAILIVGTEGMGSGTPPAPDVACWVAAEPAPAASISEPAGSTGLGVAAKKAARRQLAAQVTLFEAVNQTLLDELRAVETDALAPDEAVKLLADLKRRLI